MKYIDDMSLAESVNLKEALVPNPSPTLPLQYHDRTHHVLPTSKLHLQAALQSLEEYSHTHQMSINREKN